MIGSLVLAYSRLVRVALFIGAVLMATAAQAQTVSRDQVLSALPELARQCEAIIKASRVPGLAVAVVYDDELIFAQGFGLREIGPPDTVNADTVFQIASLSKPISSTVVAALVSKGPVTWDSKISDLDPSFRLHDPYPTAELTIRDLLAHRSGLPGTAGDDIEAIGYNREDVLRRLRFVLPSSSFRAGYSYSNAGFTEGAVAAAKPSGESWDAVAEEKLFRPLGMASTSSRYSDFLTRTNRAALHVKANGTWSAKIKRDPDTQAPAGGVSSNVRDLAQWMRLQLGNGVFDGKRLISTEALDQAHTPVMARGHNPVTGSASFYALGWNIEFGRHGLVWGHSGAFSVGAQTAVGLYPDAKLGIVVLTNAFPSGVPEGLVDTFADLAFDGKIQKDWFKDWSGVFEGMFEPTVAAAKAEYAAPPAPPTPARPSSAYEGRYANDYAGEAVVTEEAGNLVVKLGPEGKTAYHLKHFDRDLFLYYPDAEMPDKPSAIDFTLGADGKSTEMTVESLNANGLGTLKRRQ
jgi:CubicO group peptidase (beta-lactamase class C family)